MRGRYLRTVQSDGIVEELVVFLGLHVLAFHELEGAIGAHAVARPLDLAVAQHLVGLAVSRDPATRLEVEIRLVVQEQFLKGSQPPFLVVERLLVGHPAVAGGEEVVGQGRWVPDPAFSGQ